MSLEAESAGLCEPEPNLERNPAEHEEADDQADHQPRLPHHNPQHRQAIESHEKDKSPRQRAGMSPDAKLQSFVFGCVIESKSWHLVQRHQLPLDRAAQPLCLVDRLVVSELATDPRRIEL